MSMEEIDKARKAVFEERTSGMTWVSSSGAAYWLRRSFFPR